MAINQASTTGPAGRQKRRGTPLQTVFMLVGVPAGLVIWSRPVWPEGWSAQAPSWVGAVVVPAARGLMAVLVTVAVAAATLVLSSGRGISWLRYRVRWTRALKHVGLVREEKGALQVPGLASVVSTRTGHRARVRMLDNQAPGDWARRAGLLASAFGAAETRIELVASKPQQIDLVFARAQAEVA